MSSQEASLAHWRERCDALRRERDQARAALNGVDAILEDYAEGRIDSIVALAKIGVLRLYQERAA